ncbi:MAG: hypothetical protein M3014_02960, partial [Chloroflexota bacterium]|nr:hypothetical protein [Chloroflexota bacterium]
AWYHYFALVAVPFASVLFMLQDTEHVYWGMRPRLRSLVTLLFIGGMLLLTFGGESLVWPGENLGGVWKLVLSYKFYGMVALWASCLLVLESVGTHVSWCALDRQYGR